MTVTVAHAPALRLNETLGSSADVTPEGTFATLTIRGSHGEILATVFLDEEGLRALGADIETALTTVAAVNDEDSALADWRQEQAHRNFRYATDCE